MTFPVHSCVTYHVTTLAPVHPTATVTGKVLFSDQFDVGVLKESLIDIFLEWGQGTENYQLI